MRNPDLHLTDKIIELEKSPVIFSTHITGDNIVELFELHNSRWTVEGEWLTGINPEESAGMAILHEDFPGNILLEFDCRTVPPSSHDINFMWNGEWSEELNSCRNAYIGSICGWWDQRAGVEKSPGYKFRATVPNNSFVPGQMYKVQAGSVDGTCFIFIDGKLVIEAADPDPINNNLCTKVAFTAWSSHIQFRNIVIRRISWKERVGMYKPEF